MLPVDGHGGEVEDAGGDGDDGHEVVDGAVDDPEAPVTVSHKYVVEDTIQNCH